MLFELVQDNFVAVAIALFLILFVLTNNNFEKRTNMLFLAAATCVLILIIEEAWEAQLALDTVFRPMRVPLSALGYTLRPMIPYFLLLMMKPYSKKMCWILSIPLAVNALVAFSALFSNVSFGYTPDNQFVRGPLGYMPFLVASFYVFVLLVLTLKSCKNGGSGEALIVSAIGLLALVSTMLESLFGFQFIQNPSIATSIVFYYLFLHSNRNNRDPLTGALTRRRFYLDAKRYRNSITAVISLDLNDLKTLNDKYGHMRGDRALITVSDVVKKHMGTHAFFYRTGGDEFMILCFKLKEQDVQNLIADICSELARTEYRCAIGYALSAGHKDFDHICNTADKAMYEHKRQMKSEQPQESRT